jgi:hypothetical protein
MIAALPTPKLEERIVHPGALLRVWNSENMGKVIGTE